MDKLPPELQLQILEYLIPTGHRINITRYHRHNPSGGLRPTQTFSTGILLTCKAFHEHSTNLYYGRNIFKALVPDIGREEITDVVSKRYRKKIRRLVWSDDFMDKYDDFTSDRKYVYDTTRLTVIAFPNLEMLTLRDVCKARHVHDCPEILGLMYSDQSAWRETDYNTILRITHASSALKGGDVYIDAADRSTTICRAGLPYNMRDSETLIDMAEEGKDGRWVFVESGGWYHSRSSRYCSYDKENCPKYWFHFRTEATDDDGAADDNAIVNDNEYVRDWSFSEEFVSIFGQDGHSIYEKEWNAGRKIGKVVGLEDNTCPAEPRHGCNCTTCCSSSSESATSYDST